MDNTSVLLVDDEGEQLSMLSEQLQERKMNVLSATSGDEAMQILNQLHIDVVVLDVLMPGKNGLEILSEIKTNYPGTAVILLTGLVDLGTAVEGMERGAFDCLFKSLDTEELICSIEDARARKSLQRELMVARGEISK